jgi:hypothetical protein
MRLWLDNEQGLLPCTRRSSEKNQDHPIPLRACWSFDLPTQDDELLPHGAQSEVVHASPKVSGTERLYLPSASGNGTTLFIFYTNNCSSRIKLRTQYYHFTRMREYFGQDKVMD